MRYVADFGSKAFITKARVQMMRDIGAYPPAIAAFLINLGLETLPLRMERHCRNAEAVARFLASDDRISWINYPGLPDSPYQTLVQKYMPGGTCGVISFGIRGGREKAVAFMEALKLAAIVTHVADARTCVLHPASTTHRQLSDAGLQAAGISPDMIRLSVGIEHVEDILADIRQALEACSA